MHRVAKSANCGPASDAGQRLESVVADAPDHQPIAPPVGDTLERVRLVHRARRIEQILDVLHSRAKPLSSPDSTPAGLIESIAGFSRELHQVREQLALGSGSAPAAAVNFLGAVK